MLSKTQEKIMELFTARITGKFSIKEVSELSNKPYPLVHMSIKDLLSKKIIAKDSHNLISLNFRENHSTLAYIESVKCENFLNKNKTIKLFAKDVLEKIDLDFFTLLLFGSSVLKGEKARDIDVMLIVENKKDVQTEERLLDNISSSFTAHFHCNVISVESVREMLAKTDEPNVMNETINNHIIIFGDENYYRLLKYAR